MADYSFPWQVGLAIVSLIVYIVRIESKNNSNESNIRMMSDRIDKLETDHKNETAKLRSDFKEELLKIENKTAQSFSNLGSRFDVHKKTMDDMNRILAKVEAYIEHQK
jgi:hypothetical protein